MDSSCAASIERPLPCTRRPCRQRRAFQRCGSGRWFGRLLARILLRADGQVNECREGWVRPKRAPLRSLPPNPSCHHGLIPQDHRLASSGSGPTGCGPLSRKQEHGSGCRATPPPISFACAVACASYPCRQNASFCLNLGFRQTLSSPCFDDFPHKSLNWLAK
jgi:hypothetical protein